MKFGIALLVLARSVNDVTAFTVAINSRSTTTISTTTTATTLYGYLDDLSKDLYSVSDNPDIEGSTKEATDLDKEKVDRMGPGDWSTYVEFDEFDGGDGQMGVAGDGKKGLEKFGNDVSPTFAKSKTMSAKNAWGKSTGYAEKLIDQGVEKSRAQQLENWANQQEILKSKNAHRAMTETFDRVQSAGEADWRTLAKFGVERNQEFDLDEAFGPVTAGPQVEGVVELHARVGGAAVVHEFSLKNEFMGFADFRAAFTPETNVADWTITPKEGSISSKEATDFILRFKPNNPGFSHGQLVIETEDFKKTWTLIGSTS